MSLLFKGYISINLHKAALSQPENIYSHRSDHLAYFQAKKKNPKKPKTKTKARKHPRKQSNNKKQPLVTFMKLVADFFLRGEI